MLQKNHRVVAADSGFEQALRVVWSRRHDHAQARNVGEHRVVATGMMRSRRLADADAAAQHDGHLDAPAAHILHLGHLVDNLAHGVENKVDEHEVHNRPRAGHGCAGAHPDEATLRDGRVAQAHRPVQFIEPLSGVEVAAAWTYAFTDHKNRSVSRHFFGERLTGGGCVCDFTHS